MKALTSLAMILALSLVIARATFEQNLREREVILPGSVAAPRAAGPTTMLLFDLAMCLPAMLVLARRTFDPEYRLTLKTSHLLFAGMAILAAISSIWASDKFAAAVTSAHFVAAAAILWAMSQLVRSWVDLRLVAAACFGVLLVYVAQGTIYRLVEVPDLVQYFEQHRAEILQQRGYEPGSFAARQYEMKLRSGELFGFNTSPNSFAAMIVMLGVVVAGAAVQRIVDRDEPGWAAAMLIGILCSAIIAIFTYSRTAAITPLFAAAMIALAPWMSRRHKLYYRAGVAAVLIGTGLLVGHGLFHGSLVIKSFTFRWYYWVGAMSVFLKHPLLGVGWTSFGEYYLGARLPVATEEIRDPHNFVVRAFVELGAIGGILMLGWLARVCWEMTKPACSLVQDQRAQGTSLSKPFRRIVWVCAMATVFALAASVDLAFDPGYVALEFLRRVLFLALMTIGFALVLLQSSRRPQFDDRPAPWLLRAMVAAVAVFFVHNLLDFSFSEPGPMCMLAMLLGAILGARQDATASPSQRWIAAGFILTIVMWCATALGMVAPIALAESTAQQGNDDIRANQLRSGTAHLRDAFEHLWIPNSDYAFRTAIAMQQAGLPIQDSLKMLDAAIAADPIRPQNYRVIADMVLRSPMPDSGVVLLNYEKATALDPNDVALHRDFAEALARFGQRQRAIEQFRQALQYNDALPADEPKRLPAAQVEQIQAQIRSLDG